MSPRDLVRLEGVSAALGGKPVLADCDLTVRSGELLAVVGPNGAGKSTLLKIAAGVLAPDGGQVRLANAAERNRKAWARTVAYLPQSFIPYWGLTVADLLELGRRRGRMGFAAPPPWPVLDEARLIGMFGLEALLGRVMQSLSGGERARAGLAWALIGGAAVLAADEPLAALDPAHQIRTLEHLRALRGEVATVAVMHDLNLALRYADRVAVVAGGRCVACESPARLVAGEVLDQVFGVRFLRVPSAVGVLLAAETSAGIAFNESID